MTVQSAKQVRRYCQKHAELAGWTGIQSDVNGRSWLTLCKENTLIVALFIGCQDYFGHLEQKLVDMAEENTRDLADHLLKVNSFRVGPVRCWRDLREMMEGEG